jgi:hypothetical protein
VEEVSRGEVTLFNGTQEEAASMEDRLGGPRCHSSKNKPFEALFTCRKQLDAHNSELATLILKYIFQNVSRVMS